MIKQKGFKISSSLVEGLEDTIIAAQGNSGQLNIEVIPLRKLELDPQNPRVMALTFEDLYRGIVNDDPQYKTKKEEMESLSSLAQSIQEQGIINPILVYKNSDKYRLIAGERRTLASIIAGKVDIQAKILDKRPDELKKSLLQWIENIEREDLTLSERLKNLEHIQVIYANKLGKDKKEVTATELAKLIGCSLGQATRYHAVLNADASIIELIHENKITSLDKVYLVVSAASPTIQKNALQACLQGGSLIDIKSIVSKKITPVRTSKVDKRGRKQTVFNFGHTKSPEVAKLVINAILENKHFKHLEQEFLTVDWFEPKSVNAAFKTLLTALEKSSDGGSYNDQQ